MMSDCQVTITFPILLSNSVFRSGSTIRPTLPIERSFQSDGKIDLSAEESMSSPRVPTKAIFRERCIFWLDYYHPLLCCEVGYTEKAPGSEAEKTDEIRSSSRKFVHRALEWNPPYHVLLLIILNLMLHKLIHSNFPEHSDQSFSTI